MVNEVLMRYRVKLEKTDEGYAVWCPGLPGCWSQGATEEEALENIKDAIRLHVEDRLANNEPIPTSEVVSLSTLEVVV